MIYAYARVSTIEQNLEGQVDQLKQHGYDKLFHDKVSGAKKARPGFTEMQSVLKSGDTVLISRLDRLGRSLKNLIELVEGFYSMGVNLKSLDDSIDTKSANGQLIFHIFAAMADFERKLIQERTKIGLNAARARGRLGGRKPGLTESNQKKAKLVHKLYTAGEMSISEICNALDIGSRNTVYRYVKWVEEGK